jgi:hypothetical protein
LFSRAGSNCKPVSSVQRAEFGSRIPLVTPAHCVRVAASHRNEQAGRLCSQEKDARLLLREAFLKK